MPKAMLALDIYSLERRADDIGQALPAPFLIGHQRAPAGLDELVIGRFEARGRRHAAIIGAGAAFDVARQVDRRQHLFAELAAFFEDGLDHIGRRIGKARQVGVFLKAANGIEDELAVLHGGAIGGHGFILKR